MASNRAFTGRRLLEVGVITSLALVATASFRPIYSDSRVALWAITTALCCTALALLLESRRVGILLAVLANIVVGSIIVSYVALGYTMPSGVPSGETFSELAEHITRGFGRTLDALLPVQRQSPTSTLILAVLWICLAASIWLAYRSRRAVVPLIPLLLLFVSSQPIVAPTGTTDVATAVLFGILALVLLIVRAAPRIGAETASGDLPVLRSRLRIGTPLAILSGGIALLVAFAVSAPLPEDPFDPREHRDNIASLTEAVHPLDRLKPNLLADPPETHLNVTYEDPDDALMLERLALAELDVYDGARWESTNEYKATDGSLSDGHPPGLPTEDFTYTVRLTREVSPWVPTAALPIEISTDEVLIDEESGTLIRTEVARFGDYVTTSEVLLATPDDLMDATPDTTADSVRYTQVPPDLPESLATLSTDLTGEGTPFERLENLERSIAAIPYDDAATAGSSIARIERFAFDEQRGYAEQHATLFALLARAQGFPTRLMVGYRLIATEDGVGTPVQRVTGEQYHVWPEVRFEGIGWVPFEPTPDPSLDPGDLPAPAGEAPTRGNVIDQPTPDLPEEATPDETADSPTGPRSRILVTGLLLGAALLFALTILVAVLTIKVIRRRRRSRADDPGVRVLGAWAEVTERLGEVGLLLSPDMTVREVVGASGSLSDEVGDALQPIITPVHQTMYGERQVSEAAADNAWEIESRFRSASDAVGSRWRRWVRRCDPRTL